MSMQKRFSQVIPELAHKDPVELHVFVDTESNWSQTDGKTPIIKHSLRFGYAKLCRWNGRELRQEDSILFHTSEAFWYWLSVKYLPTRTWVWAHNLAFDGTLLRLWDKLQEDDCNLIHFTDCNLPSFFQANIGGKSFQFLDSLNIFRSSLAKIGEELGRPKMEMPAQAAGLDEWVPYCINDVDILHLIIEKWVQFIDTHKLGKMAPSLAGQALTAYRTRFMNHPILLHCNRSVTRLERSGYTGGICEPKFIGKVPADKIYEFDINSLYPYIMKTFKMPNMMCGFERWPSKKRYTHLMNEYYCIAHVKINTTTAIFPVRHRGRLMFPYGTYWTTLHKPELERAIDLGLVESIGFIAWYTQAHIFGDYVDFFYATRKTYNADSDKTFNYMCKIFLNSLYGKFGQKRPEWEQYKEGLVEELERKGGLRKGELELIQEHIECHDPSELKFEHPYNHKVYGCRRLLGQTQVLVGEDESPWSFPAIAGAVTSYAREYVRNIQSMIHKHGLFYTDTDSFFVDARGKLSLENHNMIDGGTLGKLKLQSEPKYLLIYGPKDYLTDKEVKRKGVRPKAKRQKDGTYRQEHWPSFKSLRREGFPAVVNVKVIYKRLKRELITLDVSDDGWTRPRLINVDNYVMY